MKLRFRISGAKPTLSYVSYCCAQTKKLYMNNDHTIYILLVFRKD